MSDPLQPTAFIRELFSSVQGEGTQIGRRQIFVRFCECHRSCRYCDTPCERTPTVRIETTPGAAEAVHEPNPATPEQLLQWVTQINHPDHAHDDLFLTGGEPLLHAAFLSTFLPAFRQRNSLPVQLETCGDLPDALDRVVQWIDHVLMDIKLPSVTGEAETWDAHRAFLDRLALTGTATTIKLVISAKTSADDLQRAGDLLRGTSEQTAIILQPMTKPAQHDLAPPAAQLLSWQSELKRATGRCVRVIPQCHKWMGLL